jgi:agmatinase
MVFIVKVPGINGLGKTRGCEDSGNKILEVLKNEIYSKENFEEIKFENLDLEEIHLDNSNLELTNSLIYKNSFEIFESGKEKTIFLGGDHSISYSTVRGFLDSCQNSNPVRNPCLIVFDAHPDLMEVTSSEGGKNKTPTHEEWLRALIEEGFPSENILIVGVRNSYIDETEFIEKNKIRVVSINNFLENLEETTEIIMEFAHGKELYLSLDIDVVDPVFAPATGYPEPAGISSRQMIYIIQRMNKMKNLRGVDIVEINSVVDEEKFNSCTIKLGARILAELI